MRYAASNFSGRAFPDLFCAATIDVRKKTIPESGG